MKRFVLFTVLFVVSIILSAQTITWTGAGDGTNWSDPDNWDLAILPNELNDVIIPGGSDVGITMGYSVEIKSITLSENSVLTLNNGIRFHETSIFEENSIVNWHFGFLTGSTLINRGTINIDLPAPSFNAPQFFETSFHNEGVVNLINGSLITWSGLINNESSGVIDIQSDGSGISCGLQGCGTFNNNGVVKKTVGLGESGICVPFQNMGIIEVLTGELKFCDYSWISFNNSENGTIKGNGLFNVSELSTYHNYGTFAPGASPGKLTFIGGFNSSATSKLEIELNGYNQGINYDFLEIQGSANFFGTIDVVLGFEPKIGDQFIISTTTGSIPYCDLEPIVNATYGAYEYTFNVSCENNQELALTVMDKTLGLDSYDMLDKNIHLYPNPTNSEFTIRNNSGQTLLGATLIDMNGRTVETIILEKTGEECTISTNNLASGFYFVRLDAGNYVLVKRLVKL